MVIQHSATVLILTADCALRITIIAEAPVQICAGIRQVHKASEDVEKLQTEAANLADFKVGPICNMYVLLRLRCKVCFQ